MANEKTWKGQRGIRRRRKKSRQATTLWQAALVRKFKFRVCVSQRWITSLVVKWKKVERGNTRRGCLWKLHVISWGSLSARPRWNFGVACKRHIFNYSWYRYKSKCIQWRWWWIGGRERKRNIHGQRLHARPCTYLGLYRPMHLPSLLEVYKEAKSTFATRLAYQSWLLSVQRHVSTTYTCRENPYFRDRSWDVYSTIFSV